MSRASKGRNVQAKGTLVHTLSLLPRLIRHRDAPSYLGVDRNRFDRDIRPSLTEVPLGDRAIAFDRHELDAWADAYIATCGRPSRKTKGGMETCDSDERHSTPRQRGTECR